MQKQNVITVLKERGFIEALSSEELVKEAEKSLNVYCGFDPTSDSLHVGNMVALMGLAWFQKYGHTPYAIVGGATGMIGDPSGKTAERQLLDAKTIQFNLQGIQKNIEKVLSYGQSAQKAVILNNYDWFKNFSFIDLLRDVGKHFRIGTMLAKDSVKSRMANDEGMSFTEFSYQVLQGYDFLYLHQHYGVNVQLGGSDQWGNITAGTDLIRKTLGTTAYGITFPLLTRSDGQKFGKSEKGAIWLSSEKLSVYEFYQYIFRTDDADVIKLMRLLTFMEMEEIKHYEQQMRVADYLPNTAQKKLATEVTRIVHGEEGLQTALRVTQGVTPGTSTILNAETLESLTADMPSHTLAKEQVLNKSLVDLIVQVNMQSSKGEAKRLMRNGGVYLNNEKVTDENLQVTQQNLIEGRLMLIAIGKKNKVLIRLQD